jgi:methylated-DNA-[protein]-cysteine S-methyltransferase
LKTACLLLHQHLRLQKANLGLMMTNTWQAQCRATTPLGPMTLVATATGLAGAWFDDQKHRPTQINVPPAPEHPVLVRAAAQLQAYFSSPATAQRACGFVFDLPLQPQGTAFQQAVWQALLVLAPGDLLSYGALAQQLGRPAAARAVGAAVGRNPIGIIIPCHRVVGSGGALTGYAGGLHRKTALLLHEGANPKTLRHGSTAAAPQPQLLLS